MIRSRDTMIVAAVYASVALACTQVPLLHSLGYEFSFVMALVASVASAVMTVRRVAFAYRHPGAAYLRHAEHVEQTFRTSLGTLIALLGIPLGIMLVNALFVRNCSIPIGLAFFLLLPVVSTVVSTSLAYFCAAHYRFPLTAFFAIAMATILYALALGYWTPAIFSYNIFYGFFPGITYDEILPLRPALIIFRFLTLIIALLFWWMARLLVRHGAPVDTIVTKGVRLVRTMVRREHRWITAGFAFVLIAAYWFRCPLGFESTARYIQSRLGASVRSDHFVIYYSPSTYSSDEIARVAAEHEFRLSQVDGAFVLAPRGIIASYLYPSAAEKQELMGAGATNIAKPWSGEIHLVASSLDATLKHELVHVVAAPFGLPVIAASPSTGLVEGLAVAVDEQPGARTLHQYAAGMMRFGIPISVHDLMSFTGFASRSSNESYLLAGSFCRFLIDRFGMRKMAMVYRTTNFKGEYGRTLEQLENDWRRYLARIPADDKDRDIIDVIFRRPSIFRKICPRVAAERMQDASRAFADGRYAAAESLYATMYRETKSYDAMSGLASSAVRAGHPDIAEALLDTVLADPIPARYLPIFVSFGDALWLRGKRLHARDVYTRVQCADLGDSFAEGLGWRMLASDDTVHGREVLDAFLVSSTDSARLRTLDALVARDPTNIPARYLMAKSLIRVGKNEQAACELDSISLERTDPRWEAVRRTTLGRVLFRQGKFDKARAMFWESLNWYDTEAAEMFVNDWVARCEWMAQNGR